MHYQNYFLCLLILAPLRFLGLADGNPGVIVGANQIVKREIYKSSAPAKVGAIQSVKCDDGKRSALALLSRYEVTMLSCDDYHVFKRYTFQDGESMGNELGLNPELVNLRRNGAFEIMKGGGGFGSVGLLNNKGNLLWGFQPHPKLPPKKMICRHGDAGRKDDFYVIDCTGIYHLSNSGHVINKFGGKGFNDINIVYDRKLQKQFLITLRNGNEFQLYDFNGEFIKKFPIQYRTHIFDVVSWPDKSDSIMIGVSRFYRNWKLILLDLNGRVVSEHLLKNFSFRHGPRGAVVYFDNNTNGYLVAVARSSSSSRLSQLNIFSPTGDLIYQEVLKGWVTIAGNPGVNDKSRVLLIGNGGTTVWEYSLKSNISEKGKQ